MGKKRIACASFYAVLGVLRVCVITESRDAATTAGCVSRTVLSLSSSTSRVRVIHGTFRPRVFAMDEMLLKMRNAVAVCV